MLKKRRLLLGGALGLLAANTPFAQNKPAVKPLILGLMPYLSTRSLLATYQPIASALENELKQPVQILTAPDFDTFVKRVLIGEYDIAVLAPHYARIAITEYGYKALLIHKAPIRSVLVTARNNPLESVAGLRNQSIAIVERSAVIVISGALWLADEGLKEDVDYHFIETVTHSSALHSAISGKSRAAIVSYAALHLAPPELQRETIVFRELSQIPGMYYLAHNRLSAPKQAAIKAALLHFEATAEGQAFFAKTTHGGFREPTREDAKLLDRMLPETRRLLSNILP